MGFRNACAWPEKVQQTTLFEQWPEIANAQFFVTAMKIRVTGDQILIIPDKSMTLEDGPCEEKAGQEVEYAMYQNEHAKVHRVIAGSKRRRTWYLVLVESEVSLLDF